MVGCICEAFLVRLNRRPCETIRCHMKQATVSDLRYNFNHIAALLQEGEEILVRINSWKSGAAGIEPQTLFIASITTRENWQRPPA